MVSVLVTRVAAAPVWSETTATPNATNAEASSAALKSTAKGGRVDLRLLHLASQCTAWHPYRLPGCSQHGGLSSIQGSHAHRPGENKRDWCCVKVKVALHQTAWRLVCRARMPKTCLGLRVSWGLQSAPTAWCCLVTRIDGIDRAMVALVHLELDCRCRHYSCIASLKKCQQHSNIGTRVNG